MNVYVYIPEDSGETGAALYDCVCRTVSADVVEIFTTCVEMHTRLLEAQTQEIILLVYAASHMDLDELALIQSDLVKHSLVLILPDRHKSTLVAGYSLSPRLTGQGHAFIQQVPQLMRKMICAAGTFELPTFATHKPRRTSAEELLVGEVDGDWV